MCLLVCVDFFCAFLVLFLVSVFAFAGVKFAEKKTDPCATSLQIPCPFSDSFVWCYFGSDFFLVLWLIRLFLLCFSGAISCECVC